MYQPPPMQHQQQQGVPPPAGLGGPQTVIVQYMNPPNFGHNPVSSLSLLIINKKSPTKRSRFSLTIEAALDLFEVVTF
jgi:hypothetical protein